MTTSLVTIVLNERDNLPVMMNSAAPAVDEFIIVDTGSCDGTLKVAKEIANLLDKPCETILWGPSDNFSEPRNYGLTKAKGDWILHLDADEELTSAGVEIVPILANRNDEYAYAFRVYEWCENSYTAISAGKLFPNNPKYRYKGHVHMEIQDIEHALVEDGPHIIHRGYATPAIKNAKLRRNIRLLNLDIADNPNDANSMYYLAISHKDLGEEEDADYWARRALSIGGQTPWVRSTLLTCFKGQTLNVRWFQ